jgi:voltage-gated potassium channel
MPGWRSSPTSASTDRRVAHHARVTTEREQPAPTPRERRLFRPIRAVFHDPEGKLILGSVAVLLAVGTVVYSILEGWTLLDSLYFSVVTLATVGYGDLHPTTDIAKLFTIGYILTGIGIVAAFASEVAKHRIPPGRIDPATGLPVAPSAGEGSSTPADPPGAG